MWVFDGNGFTMACLAVWNRNVILRQGLPQWRGGRERWATASNGSGQRCQDQRSNIRDRFHRARGGFRSAHPERWLLSWEITFVTWELQELGERLVSSWREADVGSTQPVRLGCCRGARSWF